jgi:hypothetical protein
LRAFVSNIQAFSYIYPQEKVYLHFDNTGYFLDETIWFKAYIFNAHTLRSDTLSRVLYVELLNPLGKILETKKLKIENGQCHGNFQLTPFNYDYLAGFYEIRAYTRWMLNFGSEIIFSRVMPVYNPPQEEGNYSTATMNNPTDINGFNFKNHRESKEKRKAVNIEFYPEGGNLVAGLNSLIAFRITDKQNAILSAEGEVRNVRNEMITSFSEVHNGMGSFHYTPSYNGADKVVVFYEGKEYPVDLPPILPQGYVLRVNNILESSLIIQIEKSAQMASHTLGLTLMCRGAMHIFKTIEMTENIFELQIPKEDLPSGVNQITLFDAKGEIFAERHFFVYPTQKENTTVHIMADKSQYLPREKIHIDFMTENSCRAKLSVAVRDAGATISTPSSGTMWENMLLSSDLKGYIENPAYYFSSDSIKYRMALDLLLLVQGWKRYKWQTMAGTKLFECKYPMEKGLLIKGHIVGKAKEIRFIGGEGELLMEGECVPDKDGNFSIYALDYTGRSIFTMIAPKLKDAYKNIRLDRWFSPSVKTYHLNEMQATLPVAHLKTNIPNMESVVNKYTTDIDTIGSLYEINEISVTTKRGKDLIYNVEQDVEYWLDSGEKYYPDNVHEYLIKQHNGYAYVSTFDRSQSIDLPADGGANGKFVFGNYALGIFSVVDGKPVSKYKYRSDGGYNLTPLEKSLQVEQITIFPWKKITLTSSRDSKSEIGLYCYVYPLHYRENVRAVKDVRQTPIYGYSEVEECYAGTYLPDRHEHYRTLYWNPNLQTDETGKVSIEFYNTQFCEKIEINAEGIYLTKNLESGDSIINKFINN